MKGWIIGLWALLIALPAFGADLEGSAALQAESGRFRRGEPLHQSSGALIYAGIGSEQMGASLWSDQAQGFTEGGLQLRFGGSMYSIGLVGYAQSRDASSDSVAEGSLSLHNQPGASGLWRIDYVQVSKGEGRERWVSLSGGFRAEAERFDWVGRLQVNGKDVEGLENPAHSAELHTELSFPASSSWFFIGAGLCVPLSPEAEVHILATTGAESASTRYVKAGVGYGF